MNHCELASHCSFIGLKDEDFNSHCLSNGESLFYEMLSPKNHGQVSFDKKIYQNAVLFSCTESPLTIITANHTGEKYIYHHEARGNILPQNYVHNLILLTGKFVMLE